MAVRHAAYIPNIVACTHVASNETVHLFTGHAIAGSFTWEKVEPANASHPVPAPRMFHAMGYFGQIQVFVIFGGQAENETILGDTWGFDFSDNTWKEVSNCSSHRGLCRCKLIMRGALILLE